jgi:hypothetical protein
MTDRELTKTRIETILAAKAQFDELAQTIGLQVESPLNETFQAVFTQACIAIEHAHTGNAPVKEEGGEGWLDWYIWENACGASALEAGYPETKKPIRTLDDLLDLMES